MSCVWTIMLSFSDEEYWAGDDDEPADRCPALDNINTWLNADQIRLHGPLVDLTPCATGNQTGMSANLYGGAFRHFDIETFTEVVREQEWHDPANVQLFVKGEGDQKFMLLEIEGK